ncbi:cytochrome P450 family protein [Actinoplanes sp. RD1]|uniref:cytochrome P450 family protein n=1 Tax=Actinoplanes sp. RD1 TaxID=3064538 RepID=UPI002741C09C|nr:cytochrome P450 [Actinoplanes sp. RD1]
MDIHPAVRLDETLLTDTAATYRRIAAGGPVQYAELPGGEQGWLVMGYDQARALLDDPRLSKDIRTARTVLRLNGPEWHSPMVEHMLNTDRPEHTRLRRLVSKGFTARTVAALRPAIEALTDGLLDAMGDEGRTDLVESFAFPLPIAVISEMLGVPHEDRERIREWTGALVTNDPPGSAGQAFAALAGYLTGLIERKRAEPAQDLVSALVLASDEGDQLTAQEVLIMIGILIVAGHETTVSLISSAVHSLVRHPDQLGLLRSDRSLLPGAIEEVLRFDSPVHMASLRFTTEPVTVAGVTIPRHELVRIALPAANRDESRFPEPDRFDITRDTRGHLAFGHGIHFCLGAPLARLEAEIAVGKLLDRYGRLELDVPQEDVTWRPSEIVHSLRSLPIAYGR